MALEYSTPSELGSAPHAFNLTGVDGKTYSLESFKDAKALLIVFMCNHCPYVIAIQERLNQMAKESSSKGVVVLGINSNDPLYNNDDSFENMIKTAKEWGLVFPYVFDGTQKVARAYDAVCTPDPYLYENMASSGKASDFRLRYRGRIDDSWKDESAVKEHSLKNAIEKILAHQPISANQVPSMGCGIKWKELTAATLAAKAAKAEAEGHQNKQT
jgi:peroxiredoxin